MSRIDRLLDLPEVIEALDSFDSKIEDIIDAIIRVQQIPAPTFSETARAIYIADHFLQLELVDVLRDNIHNVYGRLPGTAPDNHKPVIVSAHSDTVFPMGTDLQVRRDGCNIRGPGIGDNSTGVAGLFTLAETLMEHGLRPRADIWFVSNVGEEGMGDLRGMRAVVDRFGRQAVYIVVEGGLYGQIAHQAVGVRRFRIDVMTEGGHAWGSFGNASAVHELGYLITAIDRIEVLEDPKSTYNVGVIEGGTSINTIAPKASMLIDLRSEDPDELNRLVRRVMVIVQRAQRRAIQNKSGVTISIEQVGNRPAGYISRNAPIVRWAVAALKHSGTPLVHFVSGSTDANIPLSMGLPAVCVGLTESANSHRTDEFIETESLPAGFRQLLLLVLAAADYY